MDTPYFFDRPAVGPRLLAELAGRLTGRDKLLLSLLHEHRVLTSHQIDAMLFGSPRYANERLLDLYQLRAVDRFRPLTSTGSAPFYYVLDEAGAQIIAAQQGTTAEKLGYRRGEAMAIAYNRTLTHLVGTNGFFAALVAHSRRHPGTVLTEWLSEKRCRSAFNDQVHPDGYGHWHEGTRHVPFFLEYDTGSEDLGRVAGKMGAYAHHAYTSGSRIPVLFWLPSAVREAHLHERLRTWAETTPIHVATASPDAYQQADVADRDATPAGPIWLVASSNDEDEEHEVSSARKRVALIDLDRVWPQHHTAGTAYTNGPARAARYAPRRPSPSPALRYPDAEWPPVGRIHGGIPKGRPQWAEYWPD